MASSFVSFFSPAVRFQLQMQWTLLWRIMFSLHGWAMGSWLLTMSIMRPWPVQQYNWWDQFFKFYSHRENSSIRYRLCYFNVHCWNGTNDHWVGSGARGRPYMASHDYCVKLTLPHLSRFVTELWTPNQHDVTNLRLIPRFSYKAMNFASRLSGKNAYHCTLLMVQYLLLYQQNVLAFCYKSTIAIKKWK
jgi:hypothetical protein